MSVSASATDVGGGTIQISWSTTAETALHRTNVAVYRTDTGDLVYSGATLNGSANYFVGYSTTGTFSVAVDYYKNSNNTFDHQEATLTSASTGAAPFTPPPGAPSVPTLSGSTDTTTHAVSLSWTNVGASGYQVYRDGAVITTTGSVSYVDSPGDASTHVYSIVAYNSNAGGTTYASASNSYSSQTTGIYIKVGGSIVRKATVKAVYVKWGGTVKVT